MFNGGEEGKARMEGGGHDKEIAFLNSIRVYKDRYAIYDQNCSKMAKIDTLFITKTLVKILPRILSRSY